MAEHYTFIENMCRETDCKRFGDIFPFSFPDCRMIPTFVARISQTARAAGVMFLETIGGRYYEYIHFFLVSFLVDLRAAVVWLFFREQIRTEIW
jgi:hypothetical protein